MRIYLGLIALASLVLVGCVADEPAPPVERMPGNDVTLMEQQDEEIDICALAAQLPSDDICSLACDPAAMAERMISDGSDRGACYQLYCALPEEHHVLVGVCLPP